MPFYTYFCPHCNNEEEKFHGMFEEPTILCDKCQTPMKKKFDNCSFILKGQGWASKGTATAGTPKHFKEIGFGVPEVMKDAVSDDVKRNAVKVVKGDKNG